MSRLDIGYYTFAFLDQNSRKKISDIKDTNECIEELKYIKNNFYILNCKNLTNQLEQLCQIFEIPFKKVKKRVMASKRKSIDEYGFSKELINKIHYKDRFMYEIFKDDFEKIDFTI